VLGGHDLRFMAAQTIPVDEVFSHPHEGTFPPTSDLTLIKLSVPARFGIKYSSRMGYFSSLIVLLDWFTGPLACRPKECDISKDAYSGGFLL
jgi:hypothetical protein